MRTNTDILKPDHVKVLHQTTIMKCIQDNSYRQFIIKVLKALHLETNTFFGDLENNTPYELQIYQWINKCFAKEQSVEETITFIHLARRSFILKY